MVAPAEQQELVAGLRLERVLGRGEHSTVWSATSSGAAAPWGAERSLVVKLALEVGGGHGTMLRREARFLARVPHPNIVRLWFAGSTDDGREYLVLGAAQHGTLGDRLARGWLSLQETLTVACAAARALEMVHTRGIVHRDVKPRNLLLAHDHTLWLSDFGLAEDLTLARHGLGASRVAGSLLYAAPEQTGMLRREIDGRADLYALGVVLFECLAGRPPFQGEEAEALLRLHAAERPPDVRQWRKDTPETLARMIARLLAKDPDDRYASAGSLLADLERVSAGEELTDLATEHAGATARDHSPPPFGRELQVSEIARAVGALSSGRGGSLCVTGEPGAGKTRVCAAALAPLRRVRVLTTLQSDADGSSFAQFRALVAQLIEQANEGGEKEAALCVTLARHGEALARLFPHLPGLPAAREDMSADQAIEALVRVLAECGTKARPCVIVFEGADRLTGLDRGVLRRLHMHAQHAPLLVLCTGEGKPFSDAEHALLELHLEPLERTAVAQLLAHSLGPLPHAPRFVELLLSCSTGNPAALQRLLARALAEGVVETDGARWHVDEARLVALETSSERVSLSVLRLLDGQVNEILRHAALLGRRFASRWLALLGHAERDVSEALWQGIQRRVLVSVSEDDAMFAHAAARDALVSQVSSEDRAHLFGMLVEALEARGVSELSERELLARAHLETVHAGSAVRAWERCLEAGLSALDAFAFSEARTLLDAAAQLAERFELQADFRLHRALAQLEAQAGHVDEAITRFRISIGSCADPVERASMHLRCAELRFFHEAGHTAPMRDHLEQAWIELGERMPQPGPWSLLIALFYAVLALTIELTGIFRGVDGVTPRSRARLRICELTGMYYFWTQQLPATLRISMLGWYRGRRTGVCRDVIHGLCGLANLHLILGLKRRGDAYFGEAAQMAEQLRDAGGHAYVRYMRGIGLSLTSDIQRSERILTHSVERDSGDLDIAYLAQAAANLAASYVIRGEVQRASQVLERLRAQVQARFGQESELAETCVVSQLEMLLHAGRVELAEPVVARIKARLSDPIKDPLGWRTRWNILVGYEFARGASDAEIDQAAAQADRSPLRPEGSNWLTGRGWIVVAHARLGQYLRASPEQRPARAKIFFASADLVRRMPKDSFVRGHGLVLSAAELWLRGRVSEAQRELARAEQEGLSHDAPGVLVEVHALRARIWLDRGHEGAARYEAQCAATLAQTAGLIARARELERSFALARALPGSHSLSASHSQGSGLTSNVQRERDALLEVTVAASRELDPRSQARTVLDRLIALLGAERGLIFADGPPDPSGSSLVRLSGRTAQREDLPEDAIYAQSLVQRVRQTSVPLVLSGTEQGAQLGSESMVAGGLRSMLCAPIRLGEQTRGVIYLDNSLASGVFTRADLAILEAMGTQIALTQEMAQAARVQIERVALDKDLALSGAVQTLFLPSERDLSHGDVRLAAAYVPVSHSGGDFWNYERRPDGSLWVLLADATGHGAGAAMVTAVIAGSYRAIVNSGATRLPDVVRELHRTVAALCAGRHAATLLALELSPGDGHARLWSAGAPPVFVRSPAGEVEAHTARGGPLGTEPWALGECSFALPPGARLLMVTDGVLEMPTLDGRELGTRRLRKLFAEHGRHDAAHARDALMAAVTKARGASEVEDDLTLLILGRDT